MYKIEETIKKQTLAYFTTLMNLKNDFTLGFNTTQSNYLDNETSMDFSMPPPFK